MDSGPLFLLDFSFLLVKRELNGRMNRHSCFGKQAGISTKKIEFPVDPVIPVLEVYPKEMKCLHKSLGGNVHSSIIHSCQKVEAIHMSSNEWTDKQNAVMPSVHTYTDVVWSIT